MVVVVVVVVIVVVHTTGSAVCRAFFSNQPINYQNFLNKTSPPCDRVPATLDYILPHSTPQHSLSVSSTTKLTTFAIGSKSLTLGSNFLAVTDLYVCIVPTDLLQCWFQSAHSTDAAAAFPRFLWSGACSPADEVFMTGRYAKLRVWELRDCLDFIVPAWDGSQRPNL